MADQTHTQEAQVQEPQVREPQAQEAQAQEAQAQEAQAQEAPAAAPAKPEGATEPKPPRFRADMPQIPGVIAGGPSKKGPSVNPAIPLGIGIAAVVLVALLGARLVSHPKAVETAVAAPPPQIDVPAPAVDPNSLLPHATESAPDVATIGEMSKAWTSKSFFFVNHLTGENVPAMLIRLPQGSPNSAEGYWAYEVNAPFGNCKLEYVTDLNRLTNDYGFQNARHPMVGNPCSRSVFDPTKMSEIPGNFWVRGTIVQGSDVRPPLGIELKVQNKKIQALRME
jgi:hypothetical protein